MLVTQAVPRWRYLCCFSDAVHLHAGKATNTQHAKKTTHTKAATDQKIDESTKRMPPNTSYTHARSKTRKTTSSVLRRGTVTRGFPPASSNMATRRSASPATALRFLADLHARSHLSSDLDDCVTTDSLSPPTLITRPATDHRSSAVRRRFVVVVRFYFIFPHGRFGFWRGTDRSGQARQIEKSRTRVQAGSGQAAFGGAGTDDSTAREIKRGPQGRHHQPWLDSFSTRRLIAASNKASNEPATRPQKAASIARGNRREVDSRRCCSGHPISEIDLPKVRSIPHLILTARHLLR